MSKVTGKEIIKDMEFLTKELHKGWIKSGMTKATVTIQSYEIQKLNQTLQKNIVERLKLLEKEKLSLKENIQLSKENYVLLRIVRKIKKQEDSTKSQALQKNVNFEFVVSLDKEEVKLFQSLLT